METVEATNSIQFINLKEKTVWRYYDYASDSFKRFFETPVEDQYQILMQTKNFVIIGRYETGDLDIFVWKDGALEWLERGFHYLDIFMQDYDCKERLYKVNCRNPEICQCLFIWHDNIYLAKSFHQVDCEGKHVAELTDGGTLEISENRDYLEEGGYNITDFYVSFKDKLE